MEPMPDPTREIRIRKASSGTYDILIIGGGIVGMAAARDAAFRGYSVLLLEARDYAFGTSSRSSKLLHGGLRYLEQGEFGLVREALLERDIYIRAAPHICRAQRALVPVMPGLTRSAWQIRLGLSLYDLLAGKIFGRGKDELFLPHERISSSAREHAELRSLGLKFSDLFSYWDGQVEDTRLVIEHLIDASELGAVVLNHAEVCTLTKSADEWRVGWRNDLNGEQLESRARYVVNAGGPWAEEICGKREGVVSNQRLRYSRGTHLLFDSSLNLPGLTLATGVPGRVYFVWPYFSPAGNKTLVGTTERELPKNESDPQPSRGEIEELLAQLERDLPQADLGEGKVYRSFAGMRVLVPARAGSKNDTSVLSRRERYEEREAMLSILGGKYTTSRRTAENALDFADRFFGRKTSWQKRVELQERPLPGGRNWSGENSARLKDKLRAAVRAHASAAGDEDISKVVEASIFRLGTRVSLLLEMPGGTKPQSNFSYLAGEAALAMSIEHAATVEDIIFRRLLLRSFPLDLEQAKKELEEQGFE